MEYIAPSTRPTEALANTARLCQIETACRAQGEAQAWIDRADQELDQLEKYAAEGDLRRTQTTDPHTLLHIDDLRIRLRAHAQQLESRIGVVEASLQRAELDDWSRPPAQLITSHTSTSVKSNSIPMPLPSWPWINLFWIWLAFTGCMLVFALFGNKSGAYELMVVPAGLALYAFALARLASKAGYKGWLFILAFVPIVGVVAALMFVFKRWPIEEQYEALRRRLEVAETQIARNQ